MMSTEFLCMFHMNITAYAGDLRSTLQSELYYGEETMYHLRNLINRTIIPADPEEKHE